MALLVPVEDVGDIEFDMKSFSDNETVRLGFRMVNEGSGEKEHWLNRTAACLTTTRWGRNSDVNLRQETGAPYGRMCHAEIFMQPQPSVWVRSSIYLGTYDPDTQQIEPGKVHIKLVDDYEVQEKFMNSKLDNSSKTYEIIAFQVDRESQRNAMEFLVNQLDSPFNKNAYYYNMLGAQFGTRQYSYDLNIEKRPFYCTELLTCALQSMVALPQNRHKRSWGEPIWNSAANHSSPNSLYRIMNQALETQPSLFRMGDKSTLSLS